MKVAEHVTVEAGRQQQQKTGQAVAQKKAASSRNDTIAFVTVLTIAILSVVAMFLKSS